MNWELVNKYKKDDVLICKKSSIQYGFKKGDKYIICSASYVDDTCFYISCFENMDDYAFLSIYEIERNFYNIKELRKAKLNKLNELNR